MLSEKLALHYLRTWNYKGIGSLLGTRVSHITLTNRHVLIYRKTERLAIESDDASMLKMNTSLVQWSIEISI